MHTTPLRAASVALLLTAACSSGREPEAQWVQLARKDGAIFGGQTASRDEINGTVALVDPQQGQVFCTGTLIAPDVVLTAAHCLVQLNEDETAIGATLAPSELVVVADVINIALAQRTDVHVVSAVVAHPNYLIEVPDDPVRLFGNMNDVAVLLLDEPVTTLTPVPVLDPSRVASLVGREVTIEGFGTSDRDGTRGGGLLRIAKVPLLELGRGELIAGELGTPDACPGDSGGPVYLEQDGSLFVIGVTSRALRDATTLCGEGGIYTLVPSYLDFLRQAAPGRLRAPEPERPVDAGAPATPGSTNGSPRPGASKGDAEVPDDADEVEGDGAAPPVQVGELEACSALAAHAPSRFAPSLGLLLALTALFRFRRSQLKLARARRR